MARLLFVAISGVSDVQQSDGTFLLYQRHATSLAGVGAYRLRGIYPGRLDELELHVRAAVRNGLTEREIGEVFLQSAVYCGVPAANSAFAVAERILSETGKEE